MNYPLYTGDSPRYHIPLAEGKKGWQEVFHFSVWSALTGHLSVLQTRALGSPQGTPRQDRAPWCPAVTLAFSASEDRWRTGSGEGRMDKKIGKIYQKESLGGKGPCPSYSAPPPQHSTWQREGV